jgi:glycerophosphoryl diester phosphodiesterase
MNKPLVWAHRGASGYAPENTLESFQKAVDLKADGVELDIQLTKDGEIVVCHDETIDRTSDHTGYIKDYTLKELKSFNFNRTHPEYAHASIPTMKEVFELLKPTGLTINIELKTGEFDYEGIEEKILALTKAEGFEDRVIYSSFNHYSILKIQKLNPQARTAFLYSDGNMDMPEYGKKNQVDALHPWWVNLRYPDFMDKCRQYGLEVNVWTVNTEEAVRYCVKQGVHAVIGNYPDLARKVIEE